MIREFGNDEAENRLYIEVKVEMIRHSEDDEAVEK